MAVAQGAEPLSLVVDDTKVHSPWMDAWIQFRHNRLAVVSLIFVVGLVLMALTADIWRGLGTIDDFTFIHAGDHMVYADPMTCSVDPIRSHPQWCFVFGADGLGRDNLSRLVYGTRVSLAVAAVGSTTSFLVGIIFGVVSGYYGGRIDNIMMRIVDLLYGLPELPIIILMQVFFKALADYKDTVGPLGQKLVDINNSMGGMFFLFIAIGLLSWIGLARLARGQILSYKQKEFVEAAKAVGARDRRIIFTHLLPNIIGPLIVAEFLSIPGYIFAEAGLSYLGLGVNAPTPSWGQMLADAQKAGFLSKPFLILTPAFALAITSLAFNFLGDGLRDALDPRLRGE